MGSGVGDPFGPRCNKGDVMGCGVLFPRDFESRSDSEEEGELVVRLVENQGDTEEYETDSGEEEEWWRPDVKQGDKVQVMKGKFDKLGLSCVKLRIVKLRIEYNKILGLYERKLV